MSYNATDWAFAQTGLTGPQKLTLLTLAHHKNKDTGRCHPGIATLVQETGLARNTVIAAIKQLAQLGRLTVKKLPGGYNHYQLHDEQHKPKQKTTAQPQPAAPKTLRVNLPAELPAGKLHQLLRFNTAGVSDPQRGSIKIDTGVVSKLIPEQGKNKELTTYLPYPSASGRENNRSKQTESTRRRTLAQDLTDTSWAN